MSGVLSRTRAFQKWLKQSLAALETQLEQSVRPEGKDLLAGMANRVRIPFTHL